MTVSTPDIFGIESHRDGFPHEVFADLRRHDPVHWTEESLSPEYPWATEPGPGFWAITRHADVSHVLRNPGVFSSNLGTTLVVEPPLPQFLEMQRQMLINRDPPRHTRIRLIVNRVFTPRRVEALRDSIVDHAQRTVAALDGGGAFDFVASVAAELPLLVLCEVMGVPAADRHLLFDWSNRIIGSTDVEYGGDFDDFNNACREMFAYADELSEEKRTNPDDGVWSRVVGAEVEGERLSTSELRMFWQLLAIAGNETTRNSISGGMLALHEHGAWQSLVDDPSLLPSAIEEILRWVSPVNRFRRTATEDTEVGGQAIAAGDKVVVYYASANRDEDVFDHPETFDIRRNPNPHLAFGQGPHFCLGANLARLEMSALFAALIEGHPGLRLAGEPHRMQSTFINGIRHLPVEVS